MREIKFRAWDECKRLMLPVERFNYSFTNGNLGVFSYADNGEGESHEVMQFTGLKDKTGKDIYENDIIQCTGDAFSAIVEFDEKALCWACLLSKNGANPRRMTLNRFISTREKAVHEKIMVVGNIYETPHLA